jgi:hypothetical protein
MIRITTGLSVDVNCVLAGGYLFPYLIPNASRAIRGSLGCQHVLSLPGSAIPLIVEK